jgi:hypothetical protein
MLFSTHSEETSKRHYGIGYATAAMLYAPALACSKGRGSTRPMVVASTL